MPGGFIGRAANPEAYDRIAAGLASMGKHTPLTPEREAHLKAVAEKHGMRYPGPRKVRPALDMPT